MNNHHSSFSANNRNHYIKQLSTQSFDLLVIGGGITGAGIALDAVSRGLKVALVEKKDYAWGTSSRSTKLVHGGLRYLKQMEFKLVREVGLERAIVHNNARHVVISERMLLPIVKGGSLSRTMSSLALWVYDRLAKVVRTERRRMLSKKATLEAEPLLRSDILKAGGLYYEYRTDDARLCIENIKSAVERGALCLNYAAAEGFIYDEAGKITHARIKDEQTQKEFKVQAKVVVNAAGPWVDTLRSKDQEGVTGKRLHLSKGVHIVVDRQRLPLQQAVYFDVAGDKRMVFAIPRAGITYLGTTDTDYDQDINNPKASKADVAYILKAANHMFPSANLQESDVQSTWAGLRPLIFQEGKSASELSRKDEIFYSKTGLISIAGGKLTGYRKMAERVVDQVGKRLNNKKSCATANLKLAGGDFESDAAFEQFIVLRTGEAKQIKATSADILALAQRYGSNIEQIIEKAFEWHARFSDPKERLLAAELWYAIEHEQVLRLCDFLIRRSGRLYFERPALQAQYSFLAGLMAELLGWDDQELASNLKEFEAENQALMEWADN